MEYRGDLPEPKSRRKKTYWLLVVYYGLEGESPYSRRLWNGTIRRAHALVRLEEVMLIGEAFFINAFTELILRLLGPVDLQELIIGFLVLFRKIVSCSAEQNLK